MANARPMLLIMFLTCIGAALHPSQAAAQDALANEGADLSVGGPGSGPGEFLELRAIAFGASGELYALDGLRLGPQTRQPEGNLRVQKFARDGKLLDSIDLRDAVAGAVAPREGETIGPQRLAVTAAGDVYVTFPDIGRVCRFDAQGRLTSTYHVVRAMAVAVWNGKSGPERVAVIASRHEIVPNRGWTWFDGDRITILDPNVPADGGEARVEREIRIGRPLENVQGLTCDRGGNFYVKAEPNAVYEFSPEGRPLRTFGGNTTTRAEDGSELLHTVAVDSKDNVYSMTWGNPGWVTRFDASGQTITQRAGQFKWADPWSRHSEYVALAVDPDDRLWAAITLRTDPSDPNFRYYHPSPTIVRAKSDFFQDPPDVVRVTPVRMLGFRPALTCGLPYNVSYDPGKPVPLRFSVPAANRIVDRAEVRWRAVDAQKKQVADGAFILPLANGREAAGNFFFKPPRYGAYLVIADISSRAGSLGAIGEHVAVTPRYAGMQTLAQGQSKGEWVDAPRQVWAGLPNMRIHPGVDEAGLAKTDAEIAAAHAAGLTFIVQLVDNMKNLTPEYVRLVAARYKGRAPYYEICNEPNFSSSADDYFKGHQAAYRIIKEIDPPAKVMGPATVNMNLDWLGRLYDLGFKDVSDIISTHDYEGHESISPEHWAWKLAQMRHIMAAHDDASKPIWQTERAIAGVRGNDFQGLVQAVRCTLHRDLLETLGIPPEHNFHYYMNQGGYSSVPSYLWSENGPHPAAIALRTRDALTRGLGRSYAGKLDFGPTGDTFLMGLHYAGPTGQTVVLRNLGSRPLPVDFEVPTADTVELVDAWGNSRSVKAEASRLQLAVTQLPTYVLLKPGQELVAPKLDFGLNIAAQAKWDYSAKVEKGDFALLTNGIYETYHDGDPNGGTDGAKIWTGDLPPSADGTIPPQILTATFDTPRKFDKIIVRGVRADNGFCALLDYDLEYLDGQNWKLLEAVRNAMPASEPVSTADAKFAIWMDDTNLYVHTFAPVEGQAVRLRALRVSHGFVPDDLASAWGKQIPCKLMLREVEIYSTAPNAK
jgi:hypothetical protein